MVHIINGEIVPDDDPRVKARFAQQQHGGADAGRRRNIAGLGGGSPPPAAPAGTGAGVAPPGANPLQGLARSVGLEGTLVIPGFLGLPEKPVEKIHLAIGALMVVLFGWRALVFIIFAYVLSLQQPRTPATRPPMTGGAGPSAGMGRLS
ncbi:hypothetical protein P43SY_006078 [Pythium insidiosum]|uniref:DUF4605 domain-containing protein n=1 Tax=Pythium insidiosum TaxID=114742 RepID=A0AAD5LS53_PYTIN|nr:hypothetical protein P43SY_006078 [Pythium insidiosum]